MKKEEIAHLQNAAETWTPERVLRWAFESFGSSVAISSAFGAEGMVLIDIASRTRQNFRLFTLDTEFLFPETYNLMDQVEQKYGITIERCIHFSPRRSRNAFTVQRSGNRILINAAI